MKDDARAKKSNEHTKFKTVLNGRATMIIIRFERRLRHIVTGRETSFDRDACCYQISK